METPQKNPAFFNRAFNALPVPAIVFFASRGAHPVANDLARQLFGKRLAAPGGKGFLKRQNLRMYPKKDLPWNIALREGRGCRKDDLALAQKHPLILRALAMPIRDRGRVVAAIAAFEDITPTASLVKTGNSSKFSAL